MTVFSMNYFKAEFQKIAKNISVEESVLRSATGRGSGTSKKTPPKLLVKFEETTTGTKIKLRAFVL